MKKTGWFDVFMTLLGAISCGIIISITDGIQRGIWIGIVVFNIIARLDQIVENTKK